MYAPARAGTGPPFALYNPATGCNFLRAWTNTPLRAAAGHRLQPGCLLLCQPASCFDMPSRARRPGGNPVALAVSLQGAAGTTAADSDTRALDMNQHHATKWQVRLLEHCSDVYGVYDEDGRLLGSGSREACYHFLDVLQRPRPNGEYTKEVVADVFEQWRTH